MRRLWRTITQLRGTVPPRRVPEDFDEVRRHMKKNVGRSAAELQKRRIVGMSTLYSDTSLEAEQVLLSLLRDAPARRKLEMLGQLNRSVRVLALAGLRRRYPEATPAELQQRLAALLLGPDLAARVYPLPKHEE